MQNFHIFTKSDFKLKASNGAVLGLTLIKLFLDVVLVRLVPTDAVQTFGGQTCKHKASSVILTFKQNNLSKTHSDVPTGVLVQLPLDVVKTLNNERQTDRW